MLVYSIHIIFIFHSGREYSVNMYVIRQNYCLFNVHKLTVHQLDENG